MTPRRIAGKITLVTGLFEQFPRTLGEGLSPERDLPYPLPALDEGYRAPRPTVRPS